MTGLSVSLTSMSAVARGIAEADRVGMAANAQAATPIRNRRFIFTVSLGAAPSRRGDNARGTREFPFQIGERRFQLSA